MAKKNGSKIKEGSKIMVNRPKIIMDIPFSISLGLYDEWWYPPPPTTGVSFTHGSNDNRSHSTDVSSSPSE